MICSELTTFAVESPTLFYHRICLISCDLLRINYLCGRITNDKRIMNITSNVVICSELTTFAVESPTISYYFLSSTSCDLLRINYLCGRITNLSVNLQDENIVVICSELTTFAVESPTMRLFEYNREVL